MQAYVADEIASVVVSNHQSKGFEKILVRAGQAVPVKIPMKVEDLCLWDSRMEYVVERGNFTILAGSSSEDIRGNATLTVM